MPTIFDEQPGDEFDWATDWREAMDLQAPGATVDMTAAQQEATLTGYVKFNKERDAFRTLLGLSYADAVDPWQLHRELPVRHPRYNQLVCYAASATALGPVAQEANANGEPYAGSPFDATSRYGVYTESLFTLRFRSFGRVKFLRDDQVAAGEEALRYTTILPAPTIQTIQRQGGFALKFNEGVPLTAGTTGGPVTFNAELPELVPQANMSLKWYGVPHEYVSDSSDVLSPTRILNLLGCVNSAAFYLDRYPVGTMLLQSATFTDTLFPVSTIDHDDPATGYDIEFGLLYSPRASDAPGSTKRGHQLFPWWAQGGAGGGPYWANAVRADGSAYLREADLNGVFKHIGEP